MARRPLAQAIGFELSCFALSPVTRETGPRIDGHRGQQPQNYLRPRPSLAGEPDLGPGGSPPEPSP